MVHLLYRGQPLRDLVVHIGQSGPLKEVHRISHCAFPELPDKILSLQFVGFLKGGQPLPYVILTFPKLVDLIVEELREGDVRHLISDIFFPYEFLQELKFFEDLRRCDHGDLLDTV